MPKVSDEYTIDGLVSGDNLKSAASVRSKKYEIKTVTSDPSLLKTEYLDKGWKIQKKIKSGTKIIKEKTFGSQFENEIWNIFYKMGFEEFNSRSEKFEIARFESGVPKQIDVYARSEHTICIVECKSSETPHTSSTNRVDVRDAINDIIAMKKERMEESIFRHYYNKEGKRNTYKIIWMLALKNIEISDKDKERATNSDIYILDDSLINYYEQLAKHFGTTAKYMFLGNYMSNKKIPGEVTSVPAIKSMMGKYTFYSFVIAPEKLLRISFLSHRGNSQLTSIKTYQRIAKKNRLESIAQYIKEGGENGTGGIFPTSVVVNLSSDKLRFEPGPNKNKSSSQLGTLYLPNEYNSAWVIDGQHRLYAYSKLEEEAKTASLPVIAFENLPEAQQAKLFVDINGKQEKVENTLLLEIKANILRYSKKGNDRLEAIYSQITLDLNSDKKSLFYDKIVEANVPRNQNKNITKTMLVDELKRSRLIGAYDSKNPKDYIRGCLYVDEFDGTCQHVENIICEYYQLYLKNHVIKTQWDLGSGENGFLCTNHGIKSTLRLLTYILEYIEGSLLKEGTGQKVRDLDRNKLIAEIEPYIQPVIQYLESASPTDLSLMKKSAGESGITSTTDHFATLVNNIYPDFQPLRAQNYREKHSQENRVRNEKGRETGQSLENMIRIDVVQSLKSTFSEDLTGWWGQGVPA
ncbi:MAG: DGQHR domain-containing protein, partial [Candidatus Izemoplasmatales bacterium]